MDDIKYFYDEFGGKSGQQIAEIVQKFFSILNDDPSIISIILFFAMGFVLVMFFICVISLFFAIACLCVYFFYLCMTVFAAFETSYITGRVHQ